MPASLLLVRLIPAKWLVNFIVNVVLVPSLLAAVLKASGRSWGRVRTWILSLVVLAAVGLPLTGLMVGGFVGVSAPELYGVDGTVVVRNCAPGLGCDGSFTSHAGVTGTVPIDNHDVLAFELQPGVSVIARVYATQANPGRQDWWGLEIQPRRQTMSIPQAVLVGTILSAFWTSIGMILLIFRARHRSLESLWTSATAPFRGQRFGESCTVIGLLVAVAAGTSVVYCLFQDLSQQRGEPPIPFDCARRRCVANRSWLGLSLTCVGSCRRKTVCKRGKSVRSSPHNSAILPHNHRNCCHIRGGRTGYDQAGTSGTPRELGTDPWPDGEIRGRV